MKIKNKKEFGRPQRADIARCLNYGVFFFFIFSIKFFARDTDFFLYLFLLIISEHLQNPPFHHHTKHILG